LQVTAAATAAATALHRLPNNNNNNKKPQKLVCSTPFLKQKLPSEHGGCTDVVRPGQCGYVLLWLAWINEYRQMHGKLNAKNEQRHQQTVYREHEYNTTASGIDQYVGEKGRNTGSHTYCADAWLTATHTATSDKL
jgi:hypothetical protein